MKRAALLLALLVGAAAVARPQSAPPESNSKNIVQYQIITNDWLTVTIFQEPDLQVKERVDAQGNINCALVGQVHVYGLNIQDAEKKIEEAYKNGRFLRRPKVSISVPQYAPRSVSVQGHVRSPGRLPLDVETAVTLPDIITRAGGFDDTAKGDAVKVTRILPDGHTEVRIFDVKSVIQGKSKNNSRNPAAEFLLQPNDIVFVPQRLI
jgi:polysaccharide export outer membrane protein